MIKESGASQILGDEFVIVFIGREKGWVRYVVILTWPRSSSVAERTKDQRFVMGQDSRLELTPDGQYELAHHGRMVLLPDGRYELVDSSGTAYLLRGSTCERMKLHMKEKSIPSLEGDRFPDVAALWTFLRQFSKDAS
jgi:hypothetical protein